VNSNRTNAAVAGGLFITATVAGVASVPLLTFLTQPDYLTRASQSANQLVVATLLTIVMAFAGAGIAISLYPVLRRHSEGLALGSVVFRTIEAMAFLAVAGTQLAVLALSRKYVSAGAPDIATLQAVGAVVLAVRTWFFAGVAALAFGLGALMYYWVFYRSRLIPRWLSVWGLIAIVLHLTSAVLVMFGNDPFSATGLALNLPIFLNEMVLAVWLIVKGFSSGT
jgi:hypothetical protein